MTNDERNIRDEEIEKRLDPILAKVRASKHSTSGELLNADSMALQPTLDDTLININTEIDLFPKYDEQDLARGRDLRG